MATHSAGVVLHRRPDPHTGGVEILIVHPGGPFWAGKDEHAWSIPKGEFDPEIESAADAALREFAEELGRPPPHPPAGQPMVELPPFTAGRKVIHAVLIAGDFDAENVSSNTAEIEWPPRSGRRIEIPEVDAARWCPLDEARTKLHKGQGPIVELIAAALDAPA